MGIKYMKHVKIFVFLCILTVAASCSQQKKYVEYKVKEGETMRIIASKLDMKTSDLLRLNPNFGRKPEANSVIVIPNKKIKLADDTVKGEVLKDVIKDDITKEEAIKNEKKALKEELRKNFVVYEVKKGDTFYSLTRFYNVSQEEMVVLNPVLSEGLKVGQVIKIKPIEDGAIIGNHIYEDKINETAALKVALMLPFRAKEYDSISPENIFQKSKLANIVTDFYLGAELAIDSLRKQGIQVDLNVFDTEAKNKKIRSILSENNLNENDVIIGPLYSEEAEVVAAKVNTPVIFPFYSKKQHGFSSSQLIKTSPEKKVFREELTTYIKDNFKKGNLILVGDGKSASNSSNTIIKKSLESHDSINAVNVLKPEKGYIAKDRFLNILKPNEDNWVVLTSNNAVVLDDAINSLISLPDSTHVRVFTFNKGKSFDRIANSKLAKINLTYVSDQYVDEASVSTQLFNKQYYKKNNALPSFHATKGFDITYDVLMRLASGDKLKETFKEGASYRVESKFDYSNKLLGTSENKGLFIVQYNKDLSLTRLK
jgi:LysM repeat protein